MPKKAKYTWERATELYKTDVHRSIMENSARIIAENSMLQTEYARQTRNATSWIAVGT